jgi:hypothetical protein
VPVVGEDRGVELEPDAHDRVEDLEQQRREEDAAEADFDEERPEEAADHFRDVFTAVSAIFRGTTVDLEALTAGLSDDERAAIAALQEVVAGRDPQTQGLVYAERRLALLNDALAVLQPALAQALAPELEGLREEYDALVEGVHDLRERLESLDSAQEEIWEQDRKKDEEEGKPEPGDEDDKPDEEPEDGEGEKASTLYGDDVPEEPEKKSTVWEPDEA